MIRRFFILLCLPVAITAYAADTPLPAKPALPSYHAAAKPITDKRGTKEYRIKVSGVMARRAAAIALSRAKTAEGGK